MIIKECLTLIRATIPRTVTIRHDIDPDCGVIMQSSCSGTSLGLGLDEKKDSDKVFEENGVTFLVDDAIFATTGARAGRPVGRGSR